MKYPFNSSTVLGFVLAFATGWFMISSARANVYATNIKLNDATNNVTIGLGGGVGINYILNEPASAGVTIKILSGSTVVRSIGVASGNPGTARGTNTVTWDGKNDVGGSVSGGTYAIS